MKRVLLIQVGCGEEVLSEQAIQLVPVTPVWSHRTVSTLPDRNGNQFSPEVAEKIQTALEELSSSLMDRAMLGTLLVEPGYRKTSVGYTLVELSIVPGSAD
jgi:hypothetical protein